ncbi:MAG TPA: hypothetical protein PLO37_03285 [Candidatus Hydrogenedentes bacterium]|nr:hypothetical protein [Candidatus Hydrogenedentota bacterium]HPG65843.1 hypothetical protein [Candidatus Hydrogenedentota bacterium]
MPSIAGLDKLLHIFVSLIVTLHDPCLAIIAGVGKEVFDVLRGSSADVLDLLADLAGILLAVAFG